MYGCFGEVVKVTSSSILKSLTLNFSKSPALIFPILKHPCFYLRYFLVLGNYYFQVSFNVKLNLYVAKITQNSATEQGEEFERVSRPSDALRVSAKLLQSAVR